MSIYNNNKNIAKIDIIHNDADHILKAAILYPSIQCVFSVSRWRPAVTVTGAGTVRAVLLCWDPSCCPNLQARTRVGRAPDKMRKINFNRLYLRYFLTKSYV